MDKRNWCLLPDTQVDYDESFVPDSLYLENEIDFDFEEDEEDEYECDYPALRKMLAEYHGVTENELLQKNLVAVDDNGDLIVPDSEGEEVTQTRPNKPDLFKTEMKPPVKAEMKPAVNPEMKTEKKSSLEDLELRPEMFSPDIYPLLRCFLPHLNWGNKRQQT